MCPLAHEWLNLGCVTHISRSPCLIPVALLATMAPPVPLSAFDGLESEVGSQPDRTAQAQAPHQTEGTATPQGTDDPPLARFITDEAVGAPAIQEFVRVFFGDAGDEGMLIEPSSTLASLSPSDRDQLFREMDLPLVANGRLRKAFAAIMKHHGIIGAAAATPAANPPPTPQGRGPPSPGHFTPGAIRHCHRPGHAGDV